MSAGLDGGGRGGRGGKEFFLSSHRCPEVDLLPHHDSDTQILPPWSLVPVEKSSEFSCMGQSEANYLDVSSTRHSEIEEKEEEEVEEEEEEVEEEEGSISDWSEEDLSLHFSPSVILPSDDEESDPESSFECVDITMETQVKGQEKEGLKMVPKRQIQLKKKRDTEIIIDQEKPERLHVQPSANEQLCPSVCHRHDQLLRQHSMPASLHSTTSSDVDNYRFYRGFVAGATQGFHFEGTSRQRLQKSVSLDETKAKMASCIIKSVLSKKMQVEKNNSKTSNLQKNLVVLPSFPQPADQQRLSEGGGSKTGGGVFKPAFRVVRDMRSLVKNTYSLSFSTAPTTTTHGSNNQQTGLKVTNQKDSPPPTYQQAVGVKGQDETQRSFQASVYSRGHVNEVATSLSQSQGRKQSERFSRPIMQQRRGSEPIISRSKVDDVTWPVVVLDLPNNSPVSSDLSGLSQSGRGGGVSHHAGTSLPPSLIIQPPPRPPSTSRQLQGTKPRLSVQERTSNLGVSLQSAPRSCHQILHSCFNTATVLPASPPTLHPHLGKVSYVHNLSSYIQTQLQPPPPAPTLHLLQRSEENQSGSTGTNQPDCFIKTCPPPQSRTTVDQESNDNTKQHEQQERQQQLQQQQFLCSVQGSLPAQVGSDFLIDITGSAGTPGALVSCPAPCQMMLDPKSGRYFYMNTPPQRKMLLDPETGQYIQVFLPAANSSPNTGVLPVRCVNPTPLLINHTLSTLNPTPAVLSVMQFRPTFAMSSLYPPAYLTLQTPSVNFTHTAP